MEDRSVFVTIETRNSMPHLKIITIRGSIDAVTLKQVDEKVLPVIESGDSDIILDLSSVDYLSSTGMMCLIKYLVYSTDRKRTLKLIKPPKTVLDTLQVAGIARHFEIHDTIDAAVHAFQ
jgi:anti-sigma B factor antagonist